MNESCSASLSRTLGEAIADDLRNRILAHELAAGSVVDAARWARHYGVEKVRVLEAFKLLAREHLLTSQGAGETRVPTPSDEELRAAAALRAVLRSDAGGKVPPPPGSWQETVLSLVERRLRLGAQITGPSTGQAG